MRSRPVALGGVTAALAVVLMCMGGLIPLSTFICPLLCMILLQILMKHIGVKYAWVWYSAVAILSVLLSPDKEAAFVFLFLGYYPIIRNWFRKHPLLNLVKIAYFNVSVLVMYWLLIHVLGMSAIYQEFQELGQLMTAATLLLGNVTFFMADCLLEKLKRKF